jgi:hypothetical protein
MRSQRRLRLSAWRPERNCGGAFLLPDADASIREAPSDNSPSTSGPRRKMGCLRGCALKSINMPYYRIIYRPQLDPLVVVQA